MDEPVEAAGQARSRRSIRSSGARPRREKEKEKRRAAWNPILGSFAVQSEQHGAISDYNAESRRWALFDQRFPHSTDQFRLRT